MPHPLDFCMLFMPDPDGQDGVYHYLRRGCGWANCDAKQNRFLHANKHAHVPAKKLALAFMSNPEWSDDAVSPGALDAFDVFVLPHFVHSKVRCCSNCGFPGHNTRTCKFPTAPGIVDPFTKAEETTQPC